MNDHIKGLWIAAFSATSLGFITTLARMTYDAGSNSLTIVLLRAAFGGVLLLAIAAATRQSLYVPKPMRLPLAICGVGLSMISFGYMASVAFIPVGLAAMIFYTFPLMVLIAEAVQERRMPGPRRIAVFAVAFAGLALVIGPSFDILDWRGIACAFVGGLGTMILFLSGRKLGGTLSPITTTVYTNLFLLPLALTAVTVFDAFQVPQTEIGWWALLGAGVTYLFGIVSQITSVRYAKAAAAALVFNTEPVVSIAFAWFMLGETLSTVQLLGVALVIGAICIGSRLSAEKS